MFSCFTSSNRCWTVAASHLYNLPGIDLKQSYILAQLYYLLISSRIAGFCLKIKLYSPRLGDVVPIVVGGWLATPLIHSLYRLSQLLFTLVCIHTPGSPHRTFALLFLVIRQIAKHISNLVIATALHRILGSVHRIDRTTQCLTAVNHKQPKAIRLDTSFNQVREKVCR